MSRVPDIAILWLGAIIMGAHEGVLRDCRFGLMPIDLHAAVWSGTIQSFMQEPVFKHPKTVYNSSILRSDECRLLFLTQAEHHSRLPICQRMSFGVTALKDTDLDVRYHARCYGSHALKCAGWKWACKNGAFVYQKSNGSTPMRASSPALEQGNPLGSHISVSFEALSLEEDSASESATRSIFGWLRFEGYPPAERGIHEHPWVKVEDLEEEKELVELAVLKAVTRLLPQQPWRTGLLIIYQCRYGCLLGSWLLGEFHYVICGIVLIVLAIPNRSLTIQGLFLFVHLLYIRNGRMYDDPDSQLMVS